MSKPARNWRIEKARRTKKGQVRVLRTGRGATRQAISLGVVTQAEGDRAKAQMNLEEAQGTAQRVISLHEANPEACIAYLLGGSGGGAVANSSGVRDLVTEALLH
ncbi:MAG: hypothetical protein HN348_12085 [Proteobacteria bacterium]|nr:hypothetical protein [Pseudomonadota bacterium]